MPKAATAARTKTARPARAKAPVPEESRGWRRAEGDQTMIQELGQRMRAVREGKGLSLAQLSELSGIPGATLSRIENSKMSPTFSVLARVMMALDVDWIDLVGPKPAQPAAGEPLVSFAEPGEGRASEARGMRCTVLHSAENAHTITLVVDVQARRLDELGGLVGHRGEEFCYVMSGSLLLHMQGREPKLIRAGGSALFDSSTPHAYVAGSAGGAKILIVVTRAYGSHMAESVTLP